MALALWLGLPQLWMHAGLALSLFSSLGKCWLWEREPDKQLIVSAWLIGLACVSPRALAPNPPPPPFYFRHLGSAFLPVPTAHAH